MQVIKQGKGSPNLLHLTSLHVKTHFEAWAKPYNIIFMCQVDLAIWSILRGKRKYTLFVGPYVSIFSMNMSLIMHDVFFSKVQ